MHNYSRSTLIALALALALALGSFPDSCRAVSIEPLISYQVTPQNSREHGVNLHGADFEPHCAGIQFYVYAPTNATGGQLQVRTNDSDTIVVAAQLKITVVEPNPEFSLDATSSPEDPWLRELRSKIGFIAPGFRGAIFCLNGNYIQRTTIQFVGEREFWDLGELGNWYKP